MKKILLLSILVSGMMSIISCQQHPTNIAAATETKKEQNQNRKIYSKNVGDSFSVSVMLPQGYDTAINKKYPVMYILDANLYFDIIATAVKKYNEVGLAPAILVGINYKDFQSMDSLRDRDYTWPKAFPEYEMNASGGAEKFLHFINEELNPFIDQQYRTDTNNRILAGHSLGGYFVSYVLFEQLAGKSNSFRNFIAASPSFNYNNYYLLEEFKKLNATKQDHKLNLYFTYGGLEDEEDGDEPGIMKVNDFSRQLTRLLSDKYSQVVNCKYDYFSNLGHMETPYPSFMKGLQWSMDISEQGN